MWWAIFKYAKVAVASGLLSVVFATSVSAWSANTSPNFNISDVKVYDSYPCPGIYTTISVNGEGSIKACVMGEGAKVASYFSAQGGVAYAVSFSFDTNYYRLDICSGLWGCVYANQSDTLAGPVGVYSHFVAHLRKNIQNGVIHYTPNEDASIVAINHYQGRIFQPQTTAISENGKWVLFELRNYGIFRLEVESSEIRRIIAPGFSYGVGNDPRVEMTISNDGSLAAVVGLRMGVWLVAIDESCGDRLNEFIQTFYVGAITACRYLPIQTDAYIPSFIHALRPRFSKDDKALSFDVFSNNTTARHITLFSDTDHEQLQYLALGDSFSSGEGEVSDSFYLGGGADKCHVSTRSYPFLLATAWGASGHSVACSGATMQSARKQISTPNQFTQLAELESRTPQVATIGIGGNDAGLIGKLKNCLGLDTCKWAGTAENRRDTALEIKNLYPQLKEFYTDMKIRTLGAVIAVGYPRIISAQPKCSSTIGVLLNETERIFMNEAIHYLNQVIEAAAAESGIRYANIENVFSGGELCSSADSQFMNAIRIGDDYPQITSLPFIKIIGVESFHPKPEGHAKVAAKILQSFTSLYSINANTTSSVPTPAPPLSSYWDTEVSSSKSQKTVSFLSKVTIKKKDLFEISFPVFTFKPSSDIVLELHSDVKSIGTVQSSQDGSLSVVVSSADFDPGFHSVHVIGKSFADTDVDLYDFLAVDDNIVMPLVTTSTPTVNEGTTSVQPQKSQHIQVPVTVTSGAVLGATSVNEPVQVLAPTANQATTRQIVDNEKKVHSAYALLVSTALIAGLIAICVWVYSYKKQKTPI